METPLALTTLLMGLAGGPHCIAMCGAACGGLQTSSAGIRIWQFHLGRIIGYATLGALAAASTPLLGSQIKPQHYTPFGHFFMFWS